jgi:hypothetical protein
MSYPPRPQLRPRPEFKGTATPGRPAPDAHQRVVDYVLAEYAAGRSLRQIAELTDRSFSAVRNILHRAGIHRREAGAPPLPSARRRVSRNS